jgi:hypothetical protein
MGRISLNEQGERGRGQEAGRKRVFALLTFLALLIRGMKMIFDDIKTLVETFHG